MLCDITVSHKCNSHQNSTAAVTNQKNARKANSINCSFWQIHLNSIRFENQFVNATQTIFVCIIIWLINLPFFIILSPLFFYFFFFFSLSLYWWWKQYIKKIKIKTKNRFFLYTNTWCYHFLRQLLQRYTYVYMGAHYKHKHTREHRQHRTTQRCYSINKELLAFTTLAS